MTDLEKDWELQKGVLAIINYFEIVYLSRLICGKSSDTFKMCGINSRFDKFSEDCKNSLISFSETNESVVSRLRTSMDECLSGKMSLSEPFKDKVNHLDWMNELMYSIDAHDTVDVTLGQYLYNENYVRKTKQHEDIVQYVKTIVSDGKKINNK